VIHFKSLALLVDMKLTSCRPLKEHVQHLGLRKAKSQISESASR
jgi:hypothetical protein